MLQRADAARGNDRDRDGFGNGPRQLQVVARLCAVAVHAGQQNFARPSLNAFLRPLHGIALRRVPPAVREHRPTWAIRVFPRVDGQHDALAPEHLGRFVEDIRVLQRGGVQGNLVGAGLEHLADVGGCAHAAADGQGHENLFRHGPHNIHDRVAGFVRRGDVEKGQFVGALRLVGAGALHGVAGVAQLHELHAFDNAAARDIEARYDSFCQHSSQFHGVLAEAASASSSITPVLHHSKKKAPVVPPGSAKQSEGVSPDKGPRRANQHASFRS